MDNLETVSHLQFQINILKTVQTLISNNEKFSNVILCAEFILAMQMQFFCWLKKIGSTFNILGPKNSNMGAKMHLYDILLFKPLWMTS